MVDLLCCFHLGYADAGSCCFQPQSAHGEIKESLCWTAFWILLALLFCAGVYFFYGHHKALEFLTGYLVEYSLSIDNLFVFLLFFRYFFVPAEYEQKALIWG